MTGPLDVIINLANGTALTVEYRISFGELFVGLSMCLTSGLFVLRWVYDRARELRR